MILVTGASGFVGRSLTAALSGEERLFRAYGGRINSPAQLREALEGVESVIHLAGSEARGRVRPLQHVDVEGTARLLEECRRADIQHLVVLSRLNADPYTAYPLLRAKGEVERLVRESEVPFTILRSATLFGRRDRFLNAIDRFTTTSGPIVWLPGGGRVMMQPLWVEDVVRCLVATVDQPSLRGETLRLAGEERLSYREIVQTVLVAAGRRRILWPARLILLRWWVTVRYGWQPRPLVSRFFMDRFSVPEVAPLDSVLRHFGFRPERLAFHMSHLRR